ncbi:hypothetical protein SUGI_0697940 [Cryptomeria japonica]|nr:hypothetical protein SUGI_0697940 [Cryptomeria japonica]
MMISFTPLFSFVTRILLMSSMLHSFSLCDARNLKADGSPLLLVSSPKTEEEAANIKKKESSLIPESISVIYVEENGYPKSHIGDGESYVGSVRKALEDGGVDDHSPGIGHDDPPATP